MYWQQLWKTIKSVTVDSEHVAEVDILRYFFQYYCKPLRVIWQCIFWLFDKTYLHVYLPIIYISLLQHIFSGKLVSLSDGMLHFRAYVRWNEYAAIKHAESLISEAPCANTFQFIPVFRLRSSRLAAEQKSHITGWSVPEIIPRPGWKPGWCWRRSCRRHRSEVRQ